MENKTNASDDDDDDKQAIEEDIKPTPKRLIQVPLIDRNSCDGPWKTIIMLGETGTGKSTTINSMANYLLGVKYDDPFRYVLVQDAKGADQSKSVTQKITVYHFKPKNNEVQYGITIIDTPGFNDTKGLERDAKIWKMLKVFFENDISELDGICFTMRSTCSRLTPAQKYVQGKILDLFGNDVKDNIFFLLTFCDDKKPVALSAIKKANLPYKGRCIKLNNSAFFSGYESLLTGEGTADDDDDSDGDDTMDLSSFFWDIGYAAFKQFFFVCLPKAPKTSLKLTRHVLEDRERLETTVVGLNAQIRKGLDYLECIRVTMEEVKRHQINLDSNADFKIKVQKPHIEKIDISGQGVHTTTCRDCNFTCHDNCAFANDEDKARCCAMRNGYCTACPRKCRWDSHSNVPYLFKHTTVASDKVVLDKKKAAEAAEAGISNTEAILRYQRDKYVNVKDDVRKKIATVVSLINELREIALRKDMLDSDDHFQAMIDSEEQAQEPGFRARVRAIRKVQAEAKLLRGVYDGKTSQKLYDMDEDLKKIDQDILEVAQKYAEAAQKLKDNGGRARGWSVTDMLYSSDDCSQAKTDSEEQAHEPGLRKRERARGWNVKDYIPKF